MAEEKKSKSVLAAAAEVVGSTVGKVAALVTPAAGAPAPEKVPSPKKVVIPKLASKNKSRLPRKEKKQLQTKAARAEAKK